MTDDDIPLDTPRSLVLERLLDARTDRVRRTWSEPDHHVETTAEMGTPTHTPPRPR